MQAASAPPPKLPVSCLRTCVGCRTAAPASELVRLALRDGRLATWSGRRPPGRGASIHPRASCLTQALRTGAFARAFRTRVELSEPGELLQLLMAATVRETS